MDRLKKKPTVETKKDKVKAAEKTQISDKALEKPTLIKVEGTHVINLKERNNDVRKRQKLESDSEEVAEQSAEQQPEQEKMVIEKVK